MGKDDFKYIIKTELQLNTGSINKLLEQVREVDKQIKQHFDNAKNSGIKVPLSVHADITKLQGEVKKTVEGYQKGQVPTIRIPVSLDEKSLRNIQTRINNLKNQLNSMSNDKKSISINTSLNIGAGEKAKVQKEVGETKATMSVGLRLNENDIKVVKSQIESIKAEIKASVSAVQNHAQGLRRFGEHRTDSVGTTTNTGNRRLSLRRDKSGRFLAERQSIVDEIRAIKENEKLLNSELKELMSKKELEDRIAQLEAKRANPKSKQHDFRDANGNVIKGSRVLARDYDSTINSYKETIKKIDELQILKQELQSKEKKLNELERNVAYGSNKNYSAVRAHSPLGQLNAKLEAEKQAEKAKQDAIEKAEKEKRETARKAQDKRNKENAKFQAQLEAEDRRQETRKYKLAREASLKPAKILQRERDSAHTSALKMDRKIEWTKTPEYRKQSQERMRQRYLDSQHAQAERAYRKYQLEQQNPRVPANVNGLLDEKRLSLTQMKHQLEGRLSSIRGAISGDANMTGAQKRAQYSPQALNHISNEISKLQNQINHIEAERKQLEKEILGMNKGTKLDSHLKSGTTTNPIRDIQNRIKYNTEENARKNPSVVLPPASPNTPPPSPPNNPPKPPSPSEIARQQRVQQNIHDYNNGLVRYGGNKEHSGVDLESKLLNPNIGLKDSLGILDQIHARNQADAKNNGQNFQKAYSIRYRDDDGHIRNVRTLTYEYTSLGEKVERGDRSFKSLAGNMLRNIGIYTLFTSGIYTLGSAFGQAIRQMIQFDAQLAQIGMITQDLNTGEILPEYQSFGKGPNQAKTAIQQNAFELGQKYGVGTSETVLPVESQVLARTNLIRGKNGKIDPSMQQEMTDKIIQYSAVSTGGNATAEEVNSISQDVLSLYQAMYSKGDYNNKTNHMGKMSELLDYMATMKKSGVNTNVVADAMSELAPDTIKKDIDPKLVAGMLGAYNLSDVDGTGANMTQIGKLFFGSLAKPNNPQVQGALKELGINSSGMTQKELVSAVMETFPRLLTGQKQSKVAQGLAGLTGKSSAMTPKMVKFLEAISSDYVKQFDTANEKTPNALEKSWDAFSGTLKRNFVELGEQVKELVQQLARLGLMDLLGGIVKGLTAFLNGVNSVLHVITKFSDMLSDAGTFNFVKLGMEVSGAILAFKTFSTIVNKLAPGVGGLIGDFFERNTGRRAGFKQVAGEVVSTAPVIVPPVVPVAGKNVRNGVVATSSYRNLVTDGAIVAGSVLPIGPTSSINHAPISSRDVNSINGASTIAIAESRRNAQRGLEQTALRSATRNRASSVGHSLMNFASDALFISTFRNGGVSKAGSEVASKGAGIFKGLFAWIGKSLPLFRGLALLLTRLTLVGGALALAWYGASKIIEHANKRRADELKERTVNVNKNSKEIISNDNSFEKHRGIIKSGIESIHDFTKKSQSPTYVANIEENQKQAKLRENLKKQYSLEFSTNAKGQTIAMYHLLNSKGELSKETYKANLDTKKGKEKFDTVLENGFRNQTKTNKDDSEQWKVNLSYVMDFNKALIETNELTKEISRTTKMLGFNIEGIDAKYFGTNSASALKEKIDATQQSLGGINDERKRIADIKNQVDSNMGLLTKDLNNQINKALSNGVSQEAINSVKDEWNQAKLDGTTEDFLNNYEPPTEEDMKKWRKGDKEKGIEPMSKEQVDAKYQEMALLKTIAEIIMKVSGLSDSRDSITDAHIQNEQAIRQNEQAMREYTAQLIIASAGLGVMEAQISKINSVVSMGRTMVQMAEPNSKEQRDAQGSLIKVSSELLKGYRAELGSVNNTLSNLRSQNPNQDFSLNALYNPNGGLTSEQQAYKELLDKQNALQESVASTTADVYEQAQALKEMVLNSDKYANVWERVQNRTQLVKDANKEIYNMQNDLAMVDSMSQIRSAVTGETASSIKQSKLEQIRDRGLDTYEQLVTAMRGYDGDAQKLSQAYDEINKTMGSEFDNAFISPLKDIIKNDFTEAGNKILSGADKLDTVLGSWAKFAMESASNPSSVAGQTDAFNNAMQIPSYNSSGASQDMTFDQKVDAYVEQMGYKKGTAGFVQMRKQLVSSMTREELNTELTNNLTTTASNSTVGQYSNSINNVLTGKLSGYGDTFVKYGAKYGIDPRLMAAIAMSETGGNSKALREKNNIGGIMGSNGLKSFNSLDEGIEALADLLDRVYFKQGYNTIPKIQSKYAPSGADNDPNGLNNNWQKNVSGYYSKMTGISQSALLGGQTIDANNSSSTAVTSTNSYGTIRRGATGESVKALQKALGITADGIFGAQTEQAVRNYQKKNGLSVDGIVGSQTWGKLGIGGGSSSSSSSSSSNSKGSSPLDYLRSLVGKSPSQGGLTYVWGGGHNNDDWDTFISKAKADCSSLVDHFYKEFAGYTLQGGTSSGIWGSNQGTKISKDKLKAGDLVFFGSGGKVSHVGIYAGDNKMLNMTSSGQPLKLSDISNRSDYIGAKTFGVNDKLTAGTSTSLMSGQSTLSDMFKQSVDLFIESMNAEAQLKDPQTMKDAYFRDAYMSYGKGNVRDILGTSGRTAVFDRIGQEREGIYEQRYATVEQLKQLNTARKNYVDLANSALASGNETDYQTSKDAITAIDQLISTLTDTNKKLEEWDKYLTDVQKYDPRYNSDKATEYIRGGYDKIRSMQSEVGSSDYIRVAEEINRMNSEYMTVQNQASILGQMFGNSGVGARGYNFVKRQADQENLNIMFQKIKEINGVLVEFAQGTQDWWSTLEDAVAVQKELNDLEQQRLENAKSMFELTGEGLQGYIQQKAYTQSKEYTQTGKNLDDAINQYNGGKISKGYGLATGGYKDKEQAEKDLATLKNDYNINGKIVEEDVEYKDPKTGKVVKGKVTKIQTDETMTKERAEEVSGRMNSRGIGYGTSVTGGGSETMDMNQQLANLQVIADLHDKMIQQMNEYRNAVVEAFKAGAMSMDEYMDKMNDLRDVQNEAKENALKLVDALSSGFQDAFANALSGGMMGNMDSTQGFVDAMKQTMANAVSSAIASSIFNNSGLLDATNGFIGQIAEVIATGDPEAIANFFNNNDLGQQFTDILAPFMPLIEQIVGSTDGIFSIMKDQVFNAPQGFKIDSMLYDMAKGKDFEGVKNWDSTGRNSSGSPDQPTTGDGSPIVVPPSSNPPAGVPDGTSGSGAGSTGDPSTTVPGGTGAPTDGGTTTPAPDKSTIVGTATITADGWAGLYSKPILDKYYMLRKMKEGEKYKAYYTQGGWVNLGGGWTREQNVSIKGDIPKYHTGGIAGSMHFASPNELKPDELNAVLRHGETTFTPKQIDSIVGGKTTNNNGGDFNLNITVNVDGRNSTDELHATVETAVRRAVQEFKRDQRFQNLTWKGTSY